MVQPARFQLRTRDGETVLALSGDWVATGLGREPARLAGEIGRAGRPVRLDLSALGRLDTVGALALVETAGVTAEALGSERPDVARLIELVVYARSGASAPRRTEGGLMATFLSRLGRGVAGFGAEAVAGLAFLGRLLASAALVLARPSRLRVAPTVALMERAGLDAAPIIAATSFFVGATIAFLGASLLAQFGAQVYAVELVGIGMLREFGVLVAAIILAGRSASSFAAEIGAMRMNQEVDAMRVIGVDPFQALVIPRFLAMVLMTPLLTFVAMAAGLTGGLVVVWTVLDLSPAFFAERLLENVGPQQFWLGILKAPVLAAIIAAIGCRQGLEVGGDVEQLGRRVTGAVVQALFSIIIVDALFAMLFTELNL